MNNVDTADLLAVLLRSDLSSFIQRSFATVDPGSVYSHNWHIDAIAYQLERIARGEIRRLIITMPPRSLKSISASIAFPAWILGRYPKKRILAVSYSENLAEKLAFDCMKVLASDWYQDTFPQTRVARNRSRKFDFETTRGGGRYSASVGGALTGRGGDIIIIDDPHKPDEAQSEVRRSSVLDWYGSTLLSRCNDPATTPIIVIQQRIHENDLAGMLLEQGGWEHLNLQAVADDPESFDLGRRGHIHRKEGDLLHAERLPRDLLSDYKTQLGSYVYAAQYQQRPAPIEGGIVKWNWFKSYDVVPQQLEQDEIVQSWDTASSAGELNDYSVCTTWLVRKPQAWMLDLWRGRLEYPDLQRKIQSLAVQANANRILIEQAGSGISLIQDLSRSSDLNVIGIIPKQDKASRLMNVSAMIEAGRILIPKEAPWLADFRRELTLFPNARNDDQVDSLSQFLNWLDQPEFKWYVGGSYY
ncbi:phage terminase large subunit [Sulfitobacter sp. MF3-043]|uniref:phage terminase large subunit n=1 Tax=Sulfitobacter sediminivivens TaxID=3252902 RepID=UPI0036DF2E2E